MSHAALTIVKRPAAARGRTAIGWLDSRHTFSFGEYYDPAQLGHHHLRVINDDTVAPGQGFGTHSHRDMEIFSYVIAGQLEHKDSMGNGRIIQPGEFQYMSAGSGVRHSEFNPSKTDPVHFLQIWIEPKTPGGEPRYADMNPAQLKRENALALFASPDGHDGSIAMRQNAEIHFGHLHADRALTVPDDARYPAHWIHVISGELKIADESLSPGDGAAIDATTFDITAAADSEFLLFRLP